MTCKIYLSSQWWKRGMNVLNLYYMPVNLWLTKTSNFWTISKHIYLFIYLFLCLLVGWLIDWLIDWFMEFKPPQKAPSQRRNRSQKIIWFNSSYNKNAKSNIGREFLRLIDKCFPAGHKLRKIFSRNTLQLSYNCMPNVQQVIKGHQTRRNRHKTKPIEHATVGRRKISP